MEVLNHGARLTQLLIQKQYSPMRVSEQVVSLFAAKNKYLKDIPVEKVQAYETGLISYVNREYPYILDQIESKKELDEDLESQIKAALDAFTKEFLLMEGAQDGTK